MIYQKLMKKQSWVLHAQHALAAAAVAASNLTGTEKLINTSVFMFSHVVFIKKYKLV